MSQIDAGAGVGQGAFEGAVPRASAVIALAGLAAALSILDLPEEVRLGLRVGAGILAVVAIVAAGQRRLRRRRRGALMRLASALIDTDPVPAFVTDGEGEIFHRNAAATERFRDPFVETLGFVLTDTFANPGAVLFRLQTRAHATGHAQEDIVTRRGHIRIGVQRLGADAYLWRIEEMTDRVAAGRSAEALSLPMLTAGPSGTVLYMNEAFRRLMGGRAKSLDKVFRHLPLASGERHQVNGQNGPVDCLVAEVKGAGGRREIYLVPDDTAAARPSAPGWEEIEDLPVPLLKVAVSGEVLGGNREARSLLDTTLRPGTRLGELLDGLGRPMADWLAEAAETRSGHVPQFLRGAGRHTDTFVQVTLIPGGEGENRHLIAVLNDVTELKSLEQQFVQSQKMQAIGQLAGGVAHDFNNLLTAIAGHCDLLLLRHDQGDPDYGDLVQIHQNANRAASLVGQLLAFSRKQNLRPEQIDLRDTLAELTHLLNRLVGEKVTLTLDHDPALLPIKADKRQLEQVIMNLVVNARDAMPEGGAIRIETGNRDLEEVMVRGEAQVQPGRYVTVTVADDGVGIPPEKLTKIFEPFYTTKRTGEGTGLGLSTAYGIVKQTGGYIFADSTPGEGTTFSLFFPAQQEESDAPVAGPQAVSRPRAHGAEGVVLLVEDEAPVRAFASRALKLRGYTVLEADSAEAALDLLADPGLAVDLFVTDVIMPGKDGPTWVREALEQRPDTKVVFVSGYAEDAFGDSQSQIPNSVFLPKPFSLKELTSTVQAQLQ